MHGIVERVKDSRAWQPVAYGVLNPKVRIVDGNSIGHGLEGGKPWEEKEKNITYIG